MGIHSGLHVSSEISHNRTTQSIAYSGYAMKMAKTVGDAAAGGMVRKTFDLLLFLLQHLLQGAQQLLAQLLVYRALSCCFLQQLCIEGSA